MPRDVAPRDVIVRDVGPRDGLQLVQAVLPTATKLAWIAADAAAGIPEIEVCSFVPARVIPQFADAAEVAAGAAKIPGLTVCALTPNLRGAEIGFATGIAKLNTVLSVSESHNRRNVRRSRAESLQGLRDIIALRDRSFPDVAVGVGLATALGCTLEGAVPEAETLRWLERVLEAGADEVMLPDTVGYAHPSQVRSLFAKAGEICGDTPLWSHFHDTRGLGLANASAAGGRLHPLRRLPGGARRLPLRARRQRQHRARGPGLPARGRGPAHRHRHRGPRGAPRHRRDRPCQRAEIWNDPESGPAQGLHPALQVCSGVEP